MEKRGVGQPRAIIDWKKVEQLATAHCSITGIAKILGYSPATLSKAIEREYKILSTEYLHEHRQHGIDLMRSAIYKAGLQGNIIAQIFWLKNRDGWADKTQIQHEMLPPVQLQLPADVNLQDAKMIEQFFNANKDGNKRLSEESERLQGGQETDN